MKVEAPPEEVDKKAEVDKSKEVLGKTQQSQGSIGTKKEKKCRCAECKKAIGLAVRFQCRCGKIYCTKHRYPEAHNCTYDYKSEGKKILTESNPLIEPEKIKKI